MGFDASRSVHEGLSHLSQRLDPIIAAKLAPSLGGLPWPAILSELDKMRGKPPRSYTATDLQCQLKVITERLGSLGFPFDNHTRLVSALGSELRIVRNRWAHQDVLSTLDAWRAHDFAVRLLEHFGDVAGIAEASRLRDEAFAALAEEKGIATQIAPLPAESAFTVEAADEGESDVVRPAPIVLTRIDAAGTPTIGSGRFEFEPWAVVPVGDVGVLDDLPKKVAKEKVRAVATEIAEFEGPVHLERLARLTAASFGVRRLWPAREKKLVYQIKQTGLVIDNDKFAWPSDLDPATWGEFRPNDSSADRPFTEISPVEIANAMGFLKSNAPDISDAELDVATLQTFGRKRKTKQVAAHLNQARSLLDRHSDGPKV